MFTAIGPISEVECDNCEKPLQVRLSDADMLLVNSAVQTDHSWIIVPGSKGREHLCGSCCTLEEWCGDGITTKQRLRADPEISSIKCAIREDSSLQREAFGNALALVREASAIMESIAPAQWTFYEERRDEVGEAVSTLRRAIGEFECDDIPLGLDDLVEAYFS